MGTGSLFQLGIGLDKYLKIDVNTKLENNGKILFATVRYFRNSRKHKDFVLKNLNNISKYSDKKSVYILVWFGLFIHFTLKTRLKFPAKGEQINQTWKKLWLRFIFIQAETTEETCSKA